MYLRHLHKVPVKTVIHFPKTGNVLQTIVQGADITKSQTFGVSTPGQIQKLTIWATLRSSVSCHISCNTIRLTLLAATHHCPRDTIDTRSLTTHPAPILI